MSVSCGGETHQRPLSAGADGAGAGGVTESYFMHFMCIAKYEAVWRLLFHSQSVAAMLSLTCKHDDPAYCSQMAVNSNMSAD